jgi:autotransporter-associated beta strand protein
MNAKILRLAIVVSTTIVLITSSATAQQILHGHVPEVVARLHLRPIGRLSATNRLNLTIGLQLRNREMLTNLLQQLYDPASTNYHHYLTPEQFTEKFGPTEQDYQAVVNFAKTNGLEVVATHGSRMLLDVRGRVSDIETAFHVIFQNYQHPTEARVFYAPDVDPSVDSKLPIQEISGISDYAILRPMGHAKQIAKKSGTASGSSPNGGYYMGKDFRNAYAPGVSLNGSGQIVGLFEVDGYYNSDITNYEAQAGLTNVPLQNVLVDGSSGTPGGDNYEVALDIELALSMAPGLAAVVVYECPNNTFDWLDILDDMATNTQIKQFSSSWGYTGGEDPNAQFDSEFQKMATQGQSFFQASGDGDAWTNTIWVPADSPYVTSVGGTTLTMNGSGASYASETVWNSGYYGTAGLSGPWFANGNGYWGSGGGISGSYSIPSWQQGINMTTNHGSTAFRNIPDVAITANGIYVIYNNGSSGWFVGTSCAAPLWAGFNALVNQQATNYYQPPDGFINPAIYNIGKGASYTSCFHDITIGTNTWPGSPTNFYAVSGYDLCTGWGTPNGSNLIYALTSTGTQNLFWRGDGLTNTWNTTNANWLNGTNLVAFQSGDTVTFNDTGSNNPAINLTGLLVPAMMTVTAAQNYTLSGSGYLVGGMALTKSGAGILTLNDTGTNTYTGGIGVNGGRLVFGTGATIPANGTLTLNSTGAVTVATTNFLPNIVVNGTNSITGNGNTGTGIATLNDMGTLTLFTSGGSNVFDLTGAMTGSGNLVLGSSAMTLRFNGTSGDGSAIFNLGTGANIGSVCKTNTTAIALGGLTGGSGTQLQGDSGIGASNVTYTIGGANANTEFSGFIADGSIGTVALTKTGTGALILTGANTYSGGTTVSAGTLQLGDGLTSSGSVAGGITNNSVLVFANSLAETFSNNISGTGALGKTGAGTLTILVASSYSGGTTISNGMLLVNNVGGSATGTNAVTVANGGALGGTGKISGAVTVNSGGALTPGNPLGTLTISNNLTLAVNSTTFMHIQYSQLTNNAVKVTGTLTEGGTLNVTNIGVAAFASGDSFKLFNATNYSGAFANIVLPSLPVGLAWNTNALNASGTLSVAVIAKPVIGPISISGNGLVFNGTGGVGGANFYLLGTTNLAVPLTNWTVLLTNQFDSSGNFNFSNPFGTNTQNFYLLQLQ